MLYLRGQRFLFFSFCLWLVSLVLHGENQIIEGEEIWEIVLTPKYGVFKDPQSLPDYSNESNKQFIREATPSRIVIERHINLKPLKSDILLEETERYATKEDLEPYIEQRISGAIQKLADKLAAEKKQQIEYVNTVMYEVRDRLVWRSVSNNSAEAVLRRGTGTCAGFASLCIALLRAKGIPARHVVVQTLKHPTWNAGAHGEVEVYYEDVGWVSYDPQKHQHHAPFPRVLLGQSIHGRISSNDRPLWRAYTFFTRNPYYVKYRAIKSEIDIVNMTDRPIKHDFISRNDGYGQPIPHITGTVYDGEGNPLDMPWVYVKLDLKKRKYAGTPLKNGRYIIKNDSDGGRLYLNKKGYVIFYDFPGSAESESLQHDIRFDPGDSIVIDTGRKNSVVFWYYKSNSYYRFKAGPDGKARLHLNTGNGRWKINKTWYVFRDGRWHEE